LDVCVGIVIDVMFVHKRFLIELLGVILNGKKRSPIQAKT